MQEARLQFQQRIFGVLQGVQINLAPSQVLDTSVIFHQQQAERTSIIKSVQEKITNKNW